MKTLTKYALGAAMATSIAVSAVAADQSASEKAKSMSKQATLQQTPHAQHRQQSTVATHALVRHHRFADFGFHQNKRFNPQEARTIVKAELLLQGHKHLYPGSITKISHKRGHNNYMINIMNKNHNVVKKVVLNGANGRIRPYYS